MAALDALGAAQDGWPFDALATSQEAVSSPNSSRSWRRLSHTAF